MIRAKITTADGTVRLVQQPGQALVIDGDRMEVAPGEVALHTTHAWVIGDTYFISFMIDSRVTVHFEEGAERSEVYGPFNAMWIIDGFLLDGIEEEVPLAFPARPEGLALHAGLAAVGARRVHAGGVIVDGREFRDRSLPADADRFEEADPLDRGDDRHPA